jgi:radical SAM protein with 4Fe4S-binding SPASM domain
MLETYPRLEPDNRLHLTPSGCTFHNDAGRFDLGPDVARFLAGCDGSRRLEDLLPSDWTEPAGDVALLTVLARLLEGKRLRLLPEPAPRPIHLTGSLDAYYPTHMVLELTTACNLRCWHCYRDADARDNNHMPTAELIDILRQLVIGGLLSAELTGGEPLLHKDFLEVFDFCAEHLLLIGILSNGTVLTDAMAERFAAHANKLVMSISLDGSSAAQHDQRRGVAGSFARTCRNVRRLTDAGVKVRIAMSVDEESFHDIEKTLLLARDLGAFSFSYQPVLPLGRGKERAAMQWSLDGREVIAAEKELREKYHDFLSLMPKHELDRMETGKNCGAGHRSFVLDPLGNIRPCVTVPADQLVLGNLRTQALVDVFGSRLVHILASYAPPRPSTCSRCRLELYCRYCAVRGLLGAAEVADCRWAEDSLVREIRSSWRAEVPSETTRTCSSFELFHPEEGISGLNRVIAH